MALSDVLAKYGEVYINALKDELERGNKNATNSLSQSIRFDVKVFGLKYTLQLIADEHYQYVESGRKPNSKQPPVEPILKWIKSRGITIKQKNGKKITRKSNPNIDKQYKTLAFLMARKIGKKGIKPFPFIENAISDSMIDRFKVEVRDAVKRDIEIQVKEIAKEFKK